MHGPYAETAESAKNAEKPNTRTGLSFLLCDLCARCVLCVGNSLLSKVKHVELLVLGQREAGGEVLEQRLHLRRAVGLGEDERGGAGVEALGHAEAQLRRAVGQALLERVRVPDVRPQRSVRVIP